jgi:hypothetical protein
MEWETLKTEGTTKKSNDKNLNIKLIAFRIAQQVFFYSFRFNQSSKKILDTISSYEKFYIGAV